MSESTQMRGYPTSYAGMFGKAHGETATITRVEIPMIQRDYAQGRTDRTTNEIRETFLEALLDALSGSGPLSLDFVYGRVEAIDSGGVFRPLDGQQRLTTLFLLHWYLASKSGQLTPGVPWAQFSYATRPSAREFCEKLAHTALPQDIEKPSEWITDQPWYQYGWQFDPTVTGMLIVLDAIAEAIATRGGEFDTANAWTRLTDAEFPAISFHLLPIGDMHSDEELYITMNSRGRPLTDFENFKAQLEQIIAHSPRVREVTQKVDGVWADLMWRLDDGDRLIDDEFLRYFTFLIEICEFQQGVVDGEDRSLIKRANVVFGHENPRAGEHLDFVISAFDTWEDAAEVDTFFSEHFTDALPGGEEYDPRRLRIFGQISIDEDGVSGDGKSLASNLLRRCLQTFGTIRGRRTRLFSLAHSLLLYAVLRHRITGSENFSTRLRSLRNLIAASADNIIRLDRMPGLLADCERVVLHGELESVTTLDRFAREDEISKRAFLNDHPTLRPVLARLEDHSVLQGNLNSFEFDPEKLSQRARTFERVFNESGTWPLLTGALLTIGDYFRSPRGWSQVLFGTGRAANRATWQILLTSGSRTEITPTREVLTEFLDRLDDDAELEDQYRQMIEGCLSNREARAHYDWRYYLVKYDSMRSGWSGRYACPDRTPGYRMAMLFKSQMNSNYLDPFLLEIVLHWRSRTPEVEHHRIEDPWFTGYEHEPRWLSLVRSSTGIRSVAEGYEIRRPEEPGQASSLNAVLAGMAGVEVTEERTLVRVPQHAANGETVDSINRIGIGVEIVTALLGKGL